MHIQVTFTDIKPEQQEWLIAHLADAGFEGFEELPDTLKAFIPEGQFDPDIVKEMAFKYQLEYRLEKIESQNWNELWESNFQPVLVDDWVRVRAAFHPPGGAVQHEIIITPKMSFGTGHHATTFLMIQAMRPLQLEGKAVFDFGTGTAVLAILAEKMGAATVYAIDNDEWSIRNAADNIEVNHCARIRLRQDDKPDGTQVFDLVLANINKHVLLENMNALARSLAPGGVLLLSGVLEEDEKDILASARQNMLVCAGKTIRDNWLCIKFIHQ